ARRKRTGGKEKTTSALPSLALVIGEEERTSEKGEQRALCFRKNQGARREEDERKKKGDEREGTVDR
ncbi:hypothetical protein U1Q18_022775, partial [Sarracenia purpurea var. burkii]